MWRNVFNLGGRLLIICLVAGLALAATYGLTAPVKAANDAQRAQQALAAIYPDSQSFEPMGAEELTALQGQGYDTVSAVYRTDDGGVLVTLAVQGYHEMTVMVGIRPDSTVAGYEVLSHTETANLGDKVTKEDFIAQFRGQSAPVRYGSGVEAISGATFSSNGILEAVNTAAEILPLAGGAK